MKVYDHIKEEMDTKPYKHLRHNDEQSERYILAFIAVMVIVLLLFFAATYLN